MSEPRFCPKCGKKSAEENGSGFIERGEFDGRKFEHEGNVTAFVCTTTDCGHVHYSED
ncbi:hypothetical protein [Paenibacillus abyssi]|uniref:Uncharacterized protein n=1 Tax=Paenibacillus abyssi TaxID=1340531 RepID=A0A917G1P6_9BACL|nr:hypothetical protein [Paenibacillus abyssi]GGG18423.1 hypothetical protein GCM10010916_39060 [Paenibacillus abyssi]